MSAPDAVGGMAPIGGHFSLRAKVLNADDLRRAVTRIAHEIDERNHGVANVVLVGLYTRGVAVARRLATAIESFDGKAVPVGALDVSFHRDDFRLRAVEPQGPTEVPVDVSGRIVVVVDDVLYTGRTARAAMEGVMELGRPLAIQLAVLVDRGHRELPIRADYVGKNLPTRRSEDVRVRLVDVDAEPDGVEIWGADDDSSEAGQSFSPHRADQPEGDGEGPR